MREVPKSLKFICPHCGKETYIQERIEPVVQWNSIEMYADGTYSTCFEDNDEYDEIPEKTHRFLCGWCNEDLFPEVVGCYEARRKLYEYLLKLSCNHEIGENNAEG